MQSCRSKSLYILDRVNALVISLLLGVMLSASVSAKATTNVDELPSSDAEALISELLSWLAHRTTYDVSDTRRNVPDIILVGCGEKVTCDAKSLTIPENMEGLYDPLQNSTDESCV